MSEATRKKLLAGMLVVASVWAFYNHLKPQDEKPPSGSKVETAQPAAIQVDRAVSSEQVNIEEKTKASWGRDPFQPIKRRSTSRKSFQKVQWRLSGILYNSQSPIAIINERPVKIGEMIDDARVLEIGKKAVTLEHNGKEFTIKVTKG